MLFALGASATACDSGPENAGNQGSSAANIAELQAPEADESTAFFEDSESDVLTDNELALIELYEELVLEDPDPEQFEFVGYFRSPETKDSLWLHEESEPARTREELDAMVASFLAKDPLADKAKAPSEEGETVDRGILASADGRVYIERASYVIERRDALSEQTIFQSYTEGEDPPNVSPEAESEPDMSPESAKPGKLGEVDTDSQHQPATTQGTAADVLTTSRAVADNVIGTDDRTPIMVGSSNFPWRAAGVAVSGSGSATADPPLEPFDVEGSATMIGPRAALSARHVVLDIYTNSASTGGFLLPGARGPDYTGSSASYDSQDTPHGNRRVVWYYWPAGSHGCGSTSIKYDYGVFILKDKNFSPGWLNFGVLSLGALSYTHFNTAGYPGHTKTCGNSVFSQPSGSGPGDCGGYMYQQFGQVTNAFTNYVQMQFDFQEGQSGSGIYRKVGNTRTVHAIFACHGSVNKATRIRSGNYSSICSWVQNFPSSYFSNVSC